MLEDLRKKRVRRGKPRPYAKEGRYNTGLLRLRSGQFRPATKE